MIPASEIKVIYTGNSKATEFPFSFKFNDKSDIKVALRDIATDITTVLAKDYFVDTIKSVVLYPGYQPGQEPPANEQPEVLPPSKKIIIYRETPLSQTVDLGEKYPMAVVEGMDDKNLMISQELKEKLDRCVAVGIGADITAKELIDKIFTSAEETAISQAAAAKSEIAASKSEMAAASSAEEAGKGAATVQQVQTNIDIASKLLGTRATAYDTNKSYMLADVVMMTDGSTYRCLEASPAGENPVMSNKWTAVANSIADTFERDENGDLMPRLHPQTSSIWQIDGEGNIMPMEVI